MYLFSFKGQTTHSSRPTQIYREQTILIYGAIPILTYIFLLIRSQEFSSLLQIADWTEVVAVLTGKVFSYRKEEFSSISN